MVSTTKHLSTHSSPGRRGRKRGRRPIVRNQLTRWSCEEGPSRCWPARWQTEAAVSWLRLHKWGRLRQLHPLSRGTDSARDTRGCRRQWCNWVTWPRATSEDDVVSLICASPASEADDTVCSCSLLLSTPLSWTLHGGSVPTLTNVL